MRNLLKAQWTRNTTDCKDQQKSKSYHDWESREVPIRGEELNSSKKKKILEGLNIAGLPKSSLSLPTYLLSCTQTSKESIHGESGECEMR